VVHHHCLSSSGGAESTSLTFFFATRKNQCNVLEETAKKKLRSKSELLYHGVVQQILLYHSVVQQLAFSMCKVHQFANEHAQQRCTTEMVSGIRWRRVDRVR